MKKVLIGIGIFVALFVVAIVMLIVSLNKEKVSITATEFASFMEDKDYLVQEVTNQFVQAAGIKKGYVAGNSDFKIEFYELVNDEQAISMYNTNKAKFETMETGNYIRTHKEINNYGTYTLKVNGTYKYLSRIDNTFVYVDVLEKYEDVVEDLMDEIGY